MLSRLTFATRCAKMYACQPLALSKAQLNTTLP